MNAIEVIVTGAAGPQGPPGPAGSGGGGDPSVFALKDFTNVDGGTFGDKPFKMDADADALERSVRNRFGQASLFVAERVPPNAGLGYGTKIVAAHDDAVAARVPLVFGVGEWTLDGSVFSGASLGLASDGTGIAQVGGVDAFVSRLIPKIYAPTDGHNAELRYHRCASVRLFDFTIDGTNKGANESSIIIDGCSSFTINRVRTIAMASIHLNAQTGMLERGMVRDVYIEGAPNHAIALSQLPNAVSGHADGSGNHCKDITFLAPVVRNVGGSGINASGAENLTVLDMVGINDVVPGPYQSAYSWNRHGNGCRNIWVIGGRGEGFFRGLRFTDVFRGGAYGCDLKWMGNAGILINRKSGRCAELLFHHINILDPCRAVGWAGPGASEDDDDAAVGNGQAVRVAGGENLSFDHINVKSDFCEVGNGGMLGYPGGLMVAAGNPNITCYDTRWTGGGAWCFDEFTAAGSLLYTAQSNATLFGKILTVNHDRAYYDAAGNVILRDNYDTAGWNAIFSYAKQTAVLDGPPQISITGPGEPPVTSTPWYWRNPDPLYYRPASGGLSITAGNPNVTGDAFSQFGSDALPGLQLFDGAYRLIGRVISRTLQTCVLANGAPFTYSGPFYTATPVKCGYFMMTDAEARNLRFDWDSMEFKGDSTLGAASVHSFSVSQANSPTVSFMTRSEASVTSVDKTTGGLYVLPRTVFDSKGWRYRITGVTIAPQAAITVANASNFTQLSIYKNAGGVLTDYVTGFAIDNVTRTFNQQIAMPLGVVLDGSTLAQRCASALGEFYYFRLHGNGTGSTPPPLRITAQVLPT